MHTSDTHTAPAAGKPRHLGSELVDLSDVPLSVLRGQDPRPLARSLERLLRQVERPRVNFAGEGGPGRAD
ncbi:aldo/keto reductase [Streptomyces sp. NPDC035033]|uniref:aldo/keto reductase n=1 Tax=Streptomyces sp. NPDC035033 TaxID=3155368 RepID=UPI00340028CB